MHTLTLLSLEVLLVPIVLLAFWLWMFWDMWTNAELPDCYFTLTRNTNPRFDWTIAFILLSVFTAPVYFIIVHLQRR